ncbi:MAG: type II toxin-antitoxin system VapC family toxin [Verrucomicrobiales bacterium]|nr:type II toxin-antitoxin system VapC family toxin [Verrucomicrobiales bacterium]
MQFEPSKLSPQLTELLYFQEVRWHLSQISILEIQIKHQTGKLQLPSPPDHCLPDLIKKSNIVFHPLSNEAIFMLSKLPFIHRDPFDRLLIATALVEGWEIASVDQMFEQYPVRIVH